MDFSMNILDKTILSNLDSYGEISEIESCSPYSNIQKENNDSDSSELIVEGTLPFQMYNYIYNKKPEFELQYTTFWEAFNMYHPNVLLSPIELKMYFFEKVLPKVNCFTHLTFYQKQYFNILYDFYKDFDIFKLRTNDPVSGTHYHRADDNDVFLSLLNRPDVKIIGLTENVNYDIYSKANANHLFQMNENIRLWYSAFLRNADEIQNNNILDHDEITKRLRSYFADNKLLPTIKEINEILKSTTYSSSSSIFFNDSRTSTKINLQSPSKTTFRDQLTKSFDKMLEAIPTKKQKPKRDTKTLRKMQAKLKNPKLKELERRAKAASRRYLKLLK